MEFLFPEASTHIAPLGNSAQFPPMASIGSENMIDVICPQSDAAFFAVRVLHDFACVHLQ